MRALSRFGNTKTNAGVSVLSALVAAGIVAVAVVFVSLSKLTTLTFGTQRAAELRSERTILRSMIFNGTSCADNMTLVDCGNAENSSLALIRRHADGSTSRLTGTTPEESVMGNFVIRARCNATRDGIIVRAARPRQGTSWNSSNPDNFYPDPLTGRVVSWADDASLLFGANVEVCVGETEGGSSGGGSGGGHYTALSFGTEYTASANGLVIAFVTSTAGSSTGVKGYRCGGCVDLITNSSHPFSNSVHLVNQAYSAAGGGRGSSITFPVFAGDRWQVDRHNPGAGPTALWFISN